MKTRKHRAWAVALCVAALAAACAEKDLFDAGRADKAAKKQYTDAFTRAYPHVSLSAQAWDLTGGARLCGTRAIERTTLQSVHGIDFGVTNRVRNGRVSTTTSRNNDIVEDIKEKFPDDQPRTGERAMLVAPASGFTIYPVSAQGAYTYDVYVKVGDEEPVKLFTKDWTAYDKPYVNGMATAYDRRTGKTSTADMPGLYVEAPLGTPVQIWLRITQGDATDTPAGSEVGTATGNAIVLEKQGIVPDGAELPDGVATAEECEAKYIGIEDMRAKQGKEPEGDFNDLILAIVGNPHTPKARNIEDNGTYTVHTETVKRYMIEDLGSTADFDFNDVVVDVTEATSVRHRVTYVNGAKVDDAVERSTTKQYCVIRHLGGELDFELTVGETSLGLMKGRMGVDSEVILPVSGWKPAENNITVRVRDKANESVFHTLGFPKRGEAPMIIAVEPEQPWMAERQSIPESWFTK